MMATGAGARAAQLQLPPEVEAVFHQFRTAELSTIARDGTPVTVEVTPVWQPDHGRFLVTASIGLPRKVYNARRNPHVALLFSDPTASGLSRPPAVLVQGQATVSELLTWDEELATYWRVLWIKQPMGRRWGADPFTRWFMDWYYMRVKLHIVPRRLRWWPEGDMAQRPREVEVRQ
jgi:nitroimidazol reductase NimA-like FMN-containing flavoprotein (pyridoxamine 5'-phosphate oxidase superfamily)